MCYWERHVVPTFHEWTLFVIPIGYHYPGVKFDIFIFNKLQDKFDDNSIIW